MRDFRDLLPISRALTLSLLVDQKVQVGQHLQESGQVHAKCFEALAADCSVPR